MHARVVLLTVRMLASRVHPHHSLDQGGFTPLGLTLMQNLAQRGAHIIALSPKPVQDPEVEILLRSTSMRKLTCDPICDASFWLPANSWRYDRITSSYCY
ncbi:hypothetical protein BDR05DRAFT_970518 [Suillus weaverae]|nr:hypothetical protein BDR05DRAFT_970518 [Suillus weaverae]